MKILLNVTNKCFAIKFVQTELKNTGKSKEAAASRKNYLNKLLICHDCIEMRFSS